MDRKTLITSDSTTDLNQELIEKYNIKIVPLHVTLNDVTYTDGVDISPDDIYEAYNRSGTLPKTAAPNLDELITFFTKYIENGYDIVHFTISAEMSSTYQNSLIAANEVGHVQVVDTRNLSTGGGLLVVTAGEMALAGENTYEEIAEVCRKLTENVDASFVIDSLEFLYKGGRCSALAAFGANLLKLKPCIVVQNGTMGVGKKYRGVFANVLNKYIAEQLEDLSSIDPSRIFITHAGCNDSIVESCVKQVKNLQYFHEIHVTRAGCTISSHCGPNTLGVLFIRK